MTPDHLEVNDLANIKSAIKDAKQNVVRNERNSNARATMRTAIRQAEAALENKDENAKELAVYAIKLIDTAAGKKQVHKNYAARQKARLAKKAL